MILVTLGYAVTWRGFAVSARGGLLVAFRSVRVPTIVPCRLGCTGWNYGPFPLSIQRWMSRLSITMGRQLLLHDSGFDVGAQVRNQSPSRLGDSLARSINLTLRDP